MEEKAQRPAFAVKVCGITRRQDAEAALAAGAAFIGLNLYPPSPRSLTLEAAGELLSCIPPGKRVLVDVAPSGRKLESCLPLGFDRFQLHFDPRQVSPFMVEQWARIAGGMERLWLAPRLSPGMSFPEDLPPYADSFLFDAYAQGEYGGTGKTADWSLFKQISSRHPDKTWILAGGLGPDNIVQAVTASGASFVDVNSGIEERPGHKDPAKLRAFFQALEGFSG